MLLGVLILLVCLYGFPDEQDIHAPKKNVISFVDVKCSVLQHHYFCSTFVHKFMNYNFQFFTNILILLRMSSKCPRTSSRKCKIKENIGENNTTNTEYLPRKQILIQLPMKTVWRWLCLSINDWIHVRGKQPIYDWAIGVNSNSTLLLATITPTIDKITFPFSFSFNIHIN